MLTSIYIMFINPCLQL